MSEPLTNSANTSSQEPKTAILSLILGIAGLAVIAVSFPFAWLLQIIGVVDFLNLALLLSIAAVVCGILARRTVAQNKRSSNRNAMLGLIFGIVSITAIVVIRVLIFVLFIPMLGA